MSTTASEFVTRCFDELQIGQRFVPYVRQAEETGLPQLAKFLRALVASERAREALCRNGIPPHAEMQEDYFVCPHCGLIYDGECPEQCLVDPTPGTDFIVIH